MSASAPPTIVGLGEILWDVLPAGKQLGGAPANFAYHAQVLGARAYAASCVGDDTLGREALEQLRAAGLDVSYVASDAAHPTGTVDVELDAAGVPTYIIHEDVAWDFIPRSDALFDLARRTDAVCFGTLAQRSPVSRQTIRAFHNATPRQCLRIFDINLRQHFHSPELVRELLAISSVVKLNDQELPVLAGMVGLRGDDSDMLRQLTQQFDLRLAALTRGSEGSLLVSPASVSDRAGCAARVVDTVGAGDAFTAAVAMGLLRGMALDDINALANRLAAYVCSQPGAMPKMSADVLR